MNKPLAIADKPFSVMNANATKERSYYPQGQQYIGGMLLLFIVCLLTSCNTGKSGDPTKHGEATVPPGVSIPTPDQAQGGEEQGSKPPLVEQPRSLASNSQIDQQPEKLSELAGGPTEHGEATVPPGVSIPTPDQAQGGEEQGSKPPLVQQPRSLASNPQIDQQPEKLSELAGGPTEHGEATVPPGVSIPTPDQAQGGGQQGSKPPLVEQPRSLASNPQIDQQPEKLSELAGGPTEHGEATVPPGVSIPTPDQAQGGEQQGSKPPLFQQPQSLASNPQIDQQPEKLSELAGGPTEHGEATVPPGVSIPTPDQAQGGEQQGSKPPLVEQLRSLASIPQIDQQPQQLAELGAVLLKLAASKQEEKRDSAEDLSPYTEAAILYQHVLSISAQKNAQQKKILASNKAEKLADSAYQGLAQIQASMLARAKGQRLEGHGRGSSRALQEQIDNDRKEVQTLRNHVAEEAKRLVDLMNKQGDEQGMLAYEGAFIEGTKKLFFDIAEKIKPMLARLYGESKALLGLPPCQYAIIGLGSLALQQATPYSDLEFAILMEDAPDEDTAEEWRKYFRKLSHLVHFRVINLGETVIPKDQYGVSLDHLGRKGLNFDLGGKTPLGRKEKAYELIQPVKGMMEYLKNEDNKMEQMDKLLPYILERTCYIYGDQKLHNDYLAAQRAFWTSCQDAAGKHAYQERMRKKLLEGVSELDHSQPGVVRKGREQAGDLRTVGPKLHPEDAGRLYDVKQEIYRLPDRLLYGLATYYGLRPESAWDAVEQLEAKGIIGVDDSAKQAAHRLKYAVSFATMLRLATYIRYDQQKEDLATGSASSEQAVSELFALPKEALQEDGSLFKYYYTALALHSEMNGFFKVLHLRSQLQSDRELHRMFSGFSPGGKYTAGKEKGYFSSFGFYDTSCASKIAIYNRLLHYEQAAKCAEGHLEKVKAGYNQKKLARTHHNLGVSYYHLGSFGKSFDHFKNSLDLLEVLYPDGDPQVASVLRSLGIAHYNLSEFQESLDYFGQSLKMLKGLYQENNPETAQALDSVGDTYEQLGNFQQSIKHKQEALAMFRALYGKSHPEVARALLSLGESYALDGKLKESLEHKEKALEMFRALYGKSHSEVARALLSLGDGYAALENFEESLKRKQKALAMFQDLYGSWHPAVARVLLSLGEMYSLSGKLEESEDLKDQSWKMFQAFYREDHPEVIRALGSLSETRGRLIQDAESSKQDPGPSLQPVLTAHPQHLTLLPTPRHGKEPKGENTLLRSYYSGADFPYVKSLFDADRSRHVKDTQCQLMLREQKLAEEDKDKREDKQDEAEAGGSIQENQVASYHARLKEVTPPIRLEDLFRDDRVRPDKPVQAVQRILLTGDPGTGKTTVSKKLAYQWAVGEWGQKFHTLYLLPVRNLQQDRYNEGNYRKLNTLATAIVNNCFTHPPSDEDEYKQLRRHIEEELKKSTTLVILDGLDERAGASEKILSQAQDPSAPHKLLMLSRPYGIKIERRLANIEIDHRGFDDDQLRAYVREELSEHTDLAEELLDYIQKHANIREVAHIPVNLQILCALWQDESYGVKKEELQQDSPASLYRLFTEFIWKRYTKKWQLEEKEEALFDTLGQIALEALKQGEVLISPGLVHQYAKQDKLEARLKDAGFLLLRSIDQKFYQFPHLTFQEYFAGRLLAVQFLGDQDRKEQCKDFVKNYKYNSSYGQTLSFFSGELSNQLVEKSRTYRCDQLSNLLELLDSEPKEVVGLQHTLLQASMLHEWLCLAGQKEQDDLVSVGSQVVDSLQEWFSKEIKLSHLSQSQRGVDQLMGDYWTSKDPKLVLRIIEKLHQTPLVIRPHRRGYNELVLYLEGEDKPWQRSSEEIAQFKDLLTGELAKDCKTLHAYSHGDLRKAMSYLERYLAIYEQLYAQDPNHPDMARTLRSLGIVYGHLDKYTESLKYYQRALAIQQELHKEENHAEVAAALRSVGLACRSLGNHTESLEYYQQALKMQQTLHEAENHDDVAAALRSMAIAYQNLGNYTQSLEYFKQALTMQQELHEGENHAEVAQSLHNVGAAYHNLGNDTQALKYYQQALTMQKALHEGENHADVAAALNLVGEAYKDLGQRKQAFQYYQQALQMRKALSEGNHAGNHATLAQVLKNEGDDRTRLGRYTEALEYYQQALKMQQTLHEGENHDEVAQSLHNVGAAYYNLGNDTQALEYYQQALAMQQELHEGDHAEVAATLRSVGIAYECLGKYTEALEYYQQALTMYQELHEGDHAEVAQSLHNVGAAYHNLGNDTQALEYYQQALAMQQELHEGENHAEVVIALRDVGDAYKGLGQHEQALEYYQQAFAMHKALHEGENHVPENKDLLEALNAAPPREQRRWIAKAVGWFAGRSIATLSPVAIQDYALLAHVQVTLENRELLKYYFHSLCNKVKDGSFGEELLIQALVYVLAHLDPVIFAGDPTPLLALGINLLAKLNPSQREFKQADYPSARASLEALFQTLFLVKEVAPADLNVREGSLYQSFRSRLQEIIDRAKYYPVCYQSRILMQILHLLEAPEPDREGNMRRIAQGLLGAVNLGAVGQGLATGELRPAELQEGIALLQRAFAGQRIQPEPWYSQLLSLEEKMVHCLQQQDLSSYPDPGALEKLVQNMRMSGLNLNRMVPGKVQQYQRALRFGIAMQLQILVLEGPNPEVRTGSIQRIIALTRPEAWGSDADVMSGLLDTLALAASQSHSSRSAEVAMAIKALEALSPELSAVTSGQSGMLRRLLRSQSPQDAASRAFSAWLGEETLSAKLQRLREQTTQPAPSDEERLFSHHVKRTLRQIVTIESFRVQEIASLSQLSSYIALTKLKHFVERTTTTQQLTAILQEQGVCVLHGFVGAGKSTLAAHYGHARKETQTVRWIGAENSFKLQEGYEQLAQELRVDHKSLAKKLLASDPSQYRQELARAIYHALEKSSQPTLLILDNAEDASLIEDYLLPRPDAIQAIITTRSAEAFEGTYEQLQLSAFSQDEGQHYLEARFKAMKRPCTNPEVASLLEEVGLVPQKLNLAAGYLQANKMATTAQYIARLQALKQAGTKQQGKLTLPEAVLGLEKLTKEGQQFIQYAAYLDADFIPRSLASALLGADDPEQLSEVVSDLSRLSLVQVVYNGDQELGLQVHREVQAACREYDSWSTESGLASREAILSQLAQELARQMPWVTATPDGRWQSAKLYAPHVAKVVSRFGSPDAQPSAVVARLLGCMGQYSKEIVLNYP